MGIRFFCVVDAAIMVADVRGAVLGGAFGSGNYKNNDTAQYISNKAKIGFTMFE